MARALVYTFLLLYYCLVSELNGQKATPKVCMAQPAPGKLDVIALSNDGSTVCARNLGDLCLWNVQTGKLLRTLHPKDLVFRIRFSKDGKRLAVGGGQSAQVWDLVNGKELGQVTFEGILESFEFGANGKLLAIGTSRATVQLWKIETGRLIRKFENVQPPVALSDDGKMIAIAEDVVSLLDIASGKKLTVIV